ncbi:MAG: hypothetical protein ACRETK_08685 [Steroidobacteraceae bacterium]
MTKLIAVLALSLMGATAAQAMTHPPGTWWLKHHHDNDGQYRHHNDRLGAPTRAPEIDPASALAGLTLLMGGLAVIRGRRKS